MQAMLLAAGLGTRLAPLTDLRPKPIVPVANEPLAAFALGHLARCGATHIVANTHPRPELVEDTLGEACPGGVELCFSREETLLGTGGGLRKAWNHFADETAPVVVMNGDTLFGPDLERALQMHVSNDAVATMILRPTADPNRFGAIGLDADGVVRSLLGRPAPGPGVRPLMFTGVHVLAPEAFAAMPESGCVIRTAYRRWVDEGARVLGIVDESPWADLGTLSEYHRVNLELASGSRRWPGIVPRGGCILPSEIEPSPSIERSVVGAGARVVDGVTLRRCVVWPGTHVDRSAADAILTPDHRIAVGP